MSSLPPGCAPLTCEGPRSHGPCTEHAIWPRPHEVCTHDAMKSGSHGLCTQDTVTFMVRANNNSIASFSWAMYTTCHRLMEPSLTQAKHATSHAERISDVAH